jgi:hypothetical protein
MSMLLILPRERHLQPVFLQKNNLSLSFLSYQQILQTKAKQKFYQVSFNDVRTQTLSPFAKMKKTKARRGEDNVLFT